VNGKTTDVLVEEESKNLMEASSKEISLRIKLKAMLSMRIDTETSSYQKMKMQKMQLSLKNLKKLAFLVAKEIQAPNNLDNS